VLAGTLIGGGGGPNAGHSGSSVFCPKYFRVVGGCGHTDYRSELKRAKGTKAMTQTEITSAELLDIEQLTPSDARSLVYLAARLYIPVNIRLWERAFPEVEVHHEAVR